MSDCQGCHRPISRGWIMCGWCGVSQVAKAPKRGMMARAAGLFVALYAALVVVTALGLALFLAKQGWSMERVQFLGFIWPGVVLALGLIVWVNASMARVRERTPIAALRHRQFS